MGRDTDVDLSKATLACWDMDGFLARTAKRLFLYHLWLHRKQTGVLAPSDFRQSTKKLIGGPGRDVMSSLWPSLSDEKISQLLKEYGGIALRDPRPAEVMPGVPTELARLHKCGLRMVIVTNRKRRIEDVLRLAGLSPDWFEALYMPVGSNFPDIPGLPVYPFEEKRHAIDHARGDLPRELVVMGGDAPSDVKQGRLAGVVTVAVPDVVASAAELWAAKCSYVFDDFLQLSKQLRPYALAA